MKKMFFLGFLLCPFISTSQLKMNQIGNVGIGTTVPSSRLEVNNGDLTVKGGPSGSLDPGDLIFLTAPGVECGRIFADNAAMRFRSKSSSSGDLNIMNSNGYVGIKTGYASYPLDVVGIVRCQSLTQYSDMRFKSNVSLLPSERVGGIYLINGYTYDFKYTEPARLDSTDRTLSITEEHEHKKSIGIIAQEIREIYPELVDEDEEGILSVNYDGFIPILIEAIKQQKNEIEDLRELVERQNSLTVNSNVEKGTLKQNVPNPFSEKTFIEYEIKVLFQRATMNFYDLTGNFVYSVNLEEKQGRIEIDADKLSKGLFIYNLVADGEELASKRLIVQ